MRLARTSSTSRSPTWWTWQGEPPVARAPVLHGADQLSDRLDPWHPAEIHAEARRLYRLLGAPSGGFVGYVEEYGVMGMSEENYRACAQAFRQLGCAQ